MHRTAIVMLLTIACVFSLEGWTRVSGQEGPTKVTAQSYTGRDASAAAYRRSEWKRRVEVARHVGTIEYVRWLSGRRVYASSAIPYPANRAAFYGYGGRFGRSPVTRVFEPWPYLPGDIWGFTYRPAVAPSTKKPPVTPAPTATVPTRPTAAEEVAEPELIRHGPVSY